METMSMAGDMALVRRDEPEKSSSSPESDTQQWMMLRRWQRDAVLPWERKPQP